MKYTFDEKYEFVKKMRDLGATHIEIDGTKIDFSKPPVFDQLNPGYPLPHLGPAHFGSPWNPMPSITCDSHIDPRLNNREA